MHWSSQSGQTPAPAQRRNAWLTSSATVVSERTATLTLYSWYTTRTAGQALVTDTIPEVFEFSIGPTATATQILEVVTGGASWITKSVTFTAGNGAVIPGSYTELMRTLVVVEVVPPTGTSPRRVISSTATAKSSGEHERGHNLALEIAVPIASVALLIVIASLFSYVLKRRQRWQRTQHRTPLWQEERMKAAPEETSMSASEWADLSRRQMAVLADWNIAGLPGEEVERSIDREEVGAPADCSRREPQGDLVSVPSLN